MDMANYKPEWLDIIKTQEEKLRMESMDADGALRLGLIMVRLAKEKYGKPVSVRVITGGQITLEYYMEGTDSFNCWWMDKKLNTSRVYGLSSIRTLIEVGEGLLPAVPEFENANNYALCGGCFPLKNADGRLFGFAQSSGMTHEEDHQLIVDALSEYLGIEVPSVLK